MKKPNRKRVNLSTWIDPDQLAHLRDLSSATRVPQAVIVRDVLRRGLPEWEHERAPGPSNFLEPQDCDYESD